MEKPSFIQDATFLVRRHINMSFTLSPEGWVLPEDVTVIWSAQLHDDWRVFMSVSQLDEKCYLVWYDSDTRETIIDTYTVVGKEFFED